MHLNRRRRPEGRHVTPEGSDGCWGILGQCPVDVSLQVRCPTPLPPPPPPLPPPPPFPAISFQRLEDFRSRLTAPSFGHRFNLVGSTPPPPPPQSTGILDSSLLKNRATKYPRCCTNSLSTTANGQQRLLNIRGGEREQTTTDFTHFDVSNDHRCVPFPRRPHEAPFRPPPHPPSVPHPPPPPPPLPPSSPFLSTVLLAPRFAEPATVGRRASADETGRASLEGAALEYHDDRCRLPQQRTMRGKSTFPAGTRWHASRDVTTEIRRSSDDYIDDDDDDDDNGAPLGTTTVRRALLPTPRDVHSSPVVFSAEEEEEASSMLRRRSLCLQPAASLSTAFRTSNVAASVSIINSTVYMRRDDNFEEQTTIDRNASRADDISHETHSRRTQNSGPRIISHEVQHLHSRYQPTSSAKHRYETSDFASTRASSVEEEVSSSDVYICQICRVRCPTLENFDAHMLSEEHCRLMKAIARLHFKKTEQKLKSLKVNLKVNRKRWKYAPRGVESSRKNGFGFKRKATTKPATAMAGSTRAQQSRSHKLHKGRTPSKRSNNCVTSNRAKFLFECTLQQQHNNNNNNNNNNDDNDVSQNSSTASKNSEKSNHFVAPRGQECVVPVSGFLCKLCNKFYNDEISARITHCRSRKHLHKYQEMLRMMKTFRETTAAGADNTT